MFLVVLILPYHTQGRVTTRPEPKNKEEQERLHHVQEVSTPLHACIAGHFYGKCAVHRDCSTAQFPWGLEGHTSLGPSFHLLSQTGIN